jgi:hypothetical protein
MALGEIGTVVVLRCSFTSIADAFERDSAAHTEAGWDVFVGANEGRFAARSQGNATLLMPRLGFASGEDLAVHLREILGDKLDEHDDDRGIAWLSEAPPADEDGTYDTLVAGDHDWVEKLAKDDERLSKASGWMFGAAADGLKTDAKVVARVEAAAAADPLHEAGEKLDEKADKREGRTSMRRSLGAAVGSSFLDSPLAKTPNKPDARDLGKKASGLADALTRGGAGDSVAELETNLRDAVEGDVVAAVGDLDAVKPPEAAEDEEE